MPPKLYKKDDKIEVRVQNAAVIWYPATFLHYSSAQVYVKFETSSDPDDPTSPLRRAYVSADDVRPAQPPELHRFLKIGEIVEGFHRERKGWKKAKVEDILEHSRYTVSFEGEGSFAVMEQWEVRAVREWIDDSWNPPFLLQQVLQNKSTESQIKSRGLILKIKCSKPPEMEFREGMLVEVKSDMEGFLGSWFTAIIVESLGCNKFLVEYRTLRTDDNTEYLREEADLSCIRPSPPSIQRVKPYKYLERVDGLYNNGWWEGYISQVLRGCSYVVHFIYSNEEMTLEHCELRPHQEWIDGKWFADLKVKPTDLNMKSSKRKLSEKVTDATFKDGTMVEVKSDEEGYHGSWYTAVIVCSLSSGKFLVEYQTLKMEDESDELLREEALASYIRPCPRIIERLDHYKMLEEVDAWYNEGWWVGVICRVLDDRKYAVYFWTTNEELLFEHFSLRPHQEWVGGKWIVSHRKKSKLTLRKKLGKYKGGHNEVGGETLFMVGMKVEVKSDDHNYRGSWYPAVIVESSGRGKYLIEYQTLINDDRTQLHTGAAHALCIRPCPPIAQRTYPFTVFEEVDAWYNGGWWVGQIQKAFPCRKYLVYFSTMNVTLDFQHSDLRPHQDWFNGQWVFALRGSKSRAE
ncbi:hypothetical protein ACS0TY_027145 [Phlomoides rotata]